MSFTSIEFVFLYMPIVLVIYYLIQGNLRNICLILASVIFYTIGEPKMILFLLLTVIVNYGFGLLLSRDWKYQKLKTIFLISMLIWNVGTLFYYKYLSTILRIFVDLSSEDWAWANIVMPLGISFFTFRSISYCMDIYWQTKPVEKNIINVALYITFFPQVTMGPITKYVDFSEQFSNRTFSLTEFGDGSKRIIIGLFKKLVLSDTIGTMVDYAFSMGNDERTVIFAWMGIWGYLIQLYFDFSGYSDVAIGLGKMFGFKTPENFDYPYISKGIVEFWNRWHITLGVWLKDYLYMPIFRLFQAKKISIQHCNYIALFGVWLIVGIWHGAGKKFVFYGMYYFLFIVLERVLDDYNKKKRKKLKLKKKPDSFGVVVAKHIYVVIVIVFGQLMFRSDSLTGYFEYIKSMFGMSNNTFWNTETLFYFKQYSLNLILGTMLCFPILKIIGEKIKENRLMEKSVLVLSPIFYILLAVISFAYAFTSTYQSFIYFQF